MISALRRQTLIVPKPRHGRLRVSQVTGAVFGSILALTCQATAAQTPPPADAAAETQPAKEPQAADFQTPGDLFEELTKRTKPVWRVQYREKIVRTVTNRSKAALGLGALMTDLYLAGMARDTQQIRNLVQDEESLEKLLGITDRMTAQRQRIVMAADNSDWPELGRSVRRAVERQIELLKTLRDHDLAQLVSAGHWLRAWQISTNVVVAKNLDADSLAVGSPGMPQTLARDMEAISAQADQGDKGDKCLGVLARKTFALAKTWRNPTVETRAERLQMTQMLLGEMVDQLIQNKPSTPKSSSPESPST